MSAATGYILRRSCLSQGSILQRSSSSCRLICTTVSKNVGSTTTPFNRKTNLITTTNNINKNGTQRRRAFSSSETTSTTTAQQQHDQRLETIRKTNETLKAYAETRILAKQGKLKPKHDYYNRKESKSQLRLQGLIAGGLVIAMLSCPFLGKKIATDDEFRRTYIPTWLLPLPLRERDAHDAAATDVSEITRQQLHEQVAQLQHELHVRALRGDFTPEKLQAMRAERSKSRLSKEDMEMAEKYNWGQLHPLSDDDDDEDD